MILFLSVPIKCNFAKCYTGPSASKDQVQQNLNLLCNPLTPFAKLEINLRLQSIKVFIFVQNWRDPAGSIFQLNRLSFIFSLKSQYLSFSHKSFAADVKTIF